MLILKFKEGTKHEDYIDKLKNESLDLVSDVRDETIVINTTVHVTLHDDTYISIYDKNYHIITFRSDKSLYFDIGTDKPVSIDAILRGLGWPKRTIDIDDVNQYATAKNLLGSSVDMMIGNLYSDIRVIKSDNAKDLFAAVEECLSALNLSYAEIAAFAKFIMCKFACQTMLDSDIIKLILNLYMVDIITIYNKLSERFN